jgi:L-fucose isomerase-like protein
MSKTEKSYRSIPKIGVVITSIGGFNPGAKDASEVATRKLFDELKSSGKIDKGSIISDRIMGPHEALAVCDQLALACVDAIVLMNVAFPNGQVFLTIATHPHLAKIPIAVISDPEPSTEEWASNAWCGVIMNNHVAKAIRRPIHTFPGPVGSKECSNQLDRFLRVAGTIRDLRRDLLVRFGDAPSGFHSASGDQMAFARVFGTRLETVDMTAVMQCYQSGEISGHLGNSSFTNEEVTTLAQEICKGRTVEVPQEMMEKGVRLYFAYRALIRANGYTSAAMRCWPEQNEAYIGMSTCLAMGMLLGRGDVTAAACESDWPMAVAQTMGTLLCDQPALCLDWVNYTGGSKTIQLGHCGVGICGGMVKTKGCRQCEAIVVHPVNRQGGMIIGPVVIGQFEYGPKTGICINQDQDGEFTILAFEGENTPESAIGMKYSAADVVVKNPEKLNELVLDGGFPHHLAVATGHVAEDIQLLCKFLGVRYVNPDR